ncbi:MAG TPA: hypothetical protein VGO46_03050 [Gemmatimonadaceae bacterium]|nr:hypothetical protein [Gemmatimonadaceae bacterium]
MHTIKVIAIGCVLLVLCLVAGRTFGGSTGNGLVLGAKIFLPLWLVGAGINMWLGVSKAGYSVADEAPVFLLVFAVPAAIAGAVWWFAMRG